MSNQKKKVIKLKDEASRSATSTSALQSWRPTKPKIGEDDFYKFITVFFHNKLSMYCLRESGRLDVKPVTDLDSSSDSLEEIDDYGDLSDSCAKFMKIQRCLEYEKCKWFNDNLFDRLYHAKVAEYFAQEENGSFTRDELKSLCKLIDYSEEIQVIPYEINKIEKIRQYFNVMMKDSMNEVNVSACEKIFNMAREYAAQFESHQDEAEEESLTELIVQDSDCETNENLAIIKNPDKSNDLKRAAKSKSRATEHLDIELDESVGKMHKSSEELVVESLILKPALLDSGSFRANADFGPVDKSKFEDRPVESLNEITSANTHTETDHPSQTETPRTITTKVGADSNWVNDIEQSYSSISDLGLIKKNHQTVRPGLESNIKELIQRIQQAEERANIAGKELEFVLNIVKKHEEKIKQLNQELDSSKKLSEMLNKSFAKMETQNTQMTERITGLEALLNAMSERTRAKVNKD